MEAIFIIVLAVVFFAAFVSGMNRKPEETVSGRWGMKAGKFISGDFGGKEWGERPKKK